MFTRKKLGLIILISILGIAIIILLTALGFHLSQLATNPNIIFSNSTSQDITYNNSDITNSEVKIGDESVDQDEIKFTVTKIKNNGNYAGVPGFSYITDGTYQVFYITLNNLSESNKNISIMNYSFVDQDGRNYSGEGWQYDSGDIENYFIPHTITLKPDIPYRIAILSETSKKSTGFNITLDYKLSI